MIALIFVAVQVSAVLLLILAAYWTIYKARIGYEFILTFLAFVLLTWITIPVLAMGWVAATTGAIDSYHLFEMIDLEPLANASLQDILGESSFWIIPSAIGLLAYSAGVLLGTIGVILVLIWVTGAFVKQCLQ